MLRECMTSLLMWDVAPTALTVLHHCKLLGRFQILFSLGVFLIAQFLTIFTAFLCFHIWLVFLAFPGVATAVFAVNVSFARSSEAFQGFRWAWNLLSWANNRSLCWSQSCARYHSPMLMFRHATLLCEHCKWQESFLKAEMYYGNLKKKTNKQHKPKNIDLNNP